MWIDTDNHIPFERLLATATNEIRLTNEESRHMAECGPCYGALDELVLQFGEPTVDDAAA